MGRRKHNMPDLSTMTGAGGTIKLGGRTFLLRRLRVGDYGQVRQWLKDQLPRPFKIANDALIDLQPLREIDPEAYEASRKELLASALQDTKGDVLTTDDKSVGAIMNSPEGIAFVLWLSLRREHPNTSLEEITGLVSNEELTGIKKQLDAVNSAMQGDEDILFGDPTQPELRPAPSVK